MLGTCSLRRSPVGCEQGPHCHHRHMWHLPRMAGPVLGPPRGSAPAAWALQLIYCVHVSRRRFVPSSPCLEPLGSQAALPSVSMSPGIASAPGARPTLHSIRGFPSPAGLPGSNATSSQKPSLTPQISGPYCVFSEDPWLGAPPRGWVHWGLPSLLPAPSLGAAEDRAASPPPSVSGHSSHHLPMLPLLECCYGQGTHYPPEQHFSLVDKRMEIVTEGDT